jgi:hypothetical protein
MKCPGLHCEGCGSKSIMGGGGIIILIIIILIMIGIHKEANNIMHVIDDIILACIIAFFTALASITVGVSIIAIRAINRKVNARELQAVKNHGANAIENDAQNEIPARIFIPSKMEVITRGNHND